MIELVGDIWSYGNKIGTALVIPVNIGWKKDGSNSMGQGLAAQVAKRYPNLPLAYGEYCQQWQEKTPPVRISIARMTLILFPTKAFNAKAPQMSWRAHASIDLIRAGLEKLATFPQSESDLKEIIVPYLGCGEGGLSISAVRPIIEEYLSDSIFKLIRQENVT